MKLFAFIVSLVVASHSLFAQTLNFGNVNEKTIKKDTAFYTITGNSEAQWVYFKIMEQKPFEGVKLMMDSMRISKGTNMKISVPMEFSPKQNMQYFGLLTIESKRSILGTIELIGQGVFSNTYYSTTQNKSAEVLKAALKTRIGQGYVSFSYNVARDNMYGSIDNVGGFVECVYTGKTAKFNTRAGANSAGFNCEHTFPQGFFSSALPMKSDLHHLFPTTNTSNSRRGNDPFGIVSNPSWSDGGSKSGGGKFEPRDFHKGTVARAMLYFGIRYKDYSGHLASQESILRSWLTQFPVSAKDIKRNNDIYGLQKNRNPFVDYPQFLERISSVTGTAIDAKISSLEWSKSLRHQNGDTIFDGNRTLFTHVLYNAGNTDIKIDSVFMSNGSKAVTSKVTTGAESIVLKPKQTREIKVELDAFSVGGYLVIMDSIIIKTDVSGLNRMSFEQNAVFVTGNSINEYTVSNELKIYPNPVSNHLFIERDGVGVFYTTIIDLQGKVVFNAKNTSKTIDVSSLPQGEYIIRVESEKGEVKIGRFIKQ